MAKSIDLTYTEERYGPDLKFGAVFTQYGDGEVFIRAYDIWDVTGEPHKQEYFVTCLTHNEAIQLRDWLNENVKDF